MCETLRDIFSSLYMNDSDSIFDSDLFDFAKNLTIENRSIIPRLFRYTPATYHSIRGLETETLYLCPNGSMNDIFEGLSGKVSDKVLNQITRINDTIFLKSFCEEKDNLLMWAHYADSYAGFCVEYDFKNIDNAILFHLFPVVYSEKRKSLISFEYTMDELEDLKKMNEEGCYPNETDFIKDIMPYFLIKPKCWEYEKEWRLIATYPQIYNSADEIGDEYAEFYGWNSQFVSVRKCIKAVYLGPRIKNDVKKHIKEICKKRLQGIPVYDGRLSREKFELEFIRSEEQ